MVAWYDYLVVTIDYLVVTIDCLVERDIRGYTLNHKGLQSEPSSIAVWAIRGCILGRQGSHSAAGAVSTRILSHQKLHSEPSEAAV